MIAQVARHLGREVYAFTRPGDTRAQAFAREVGCVWAGNSNERPGTELDAAIIFAPQASSSRLRFAQSRRAPRWYAAAFT